MNDQDLKEYEDLKQKKHDIACRIDLDMAMIKLIDKRLDELRFKS